MAKLPAFGHWHSARLWYLQCVIYWDTNLGPYDMYDLLRLTKLCSCNGVMSEGNLTPRRLCTFADNS